MSIIFKCNIKSLKHPATYCDGKYNYKIAGFQRSYFPKFNMSMHLTCRGLWLLLQMIKMSMAHIKDSRTCPRTFIFLYRLHSHLSRTHLQPMESILIGAVLVERIYSQDSMIMCQCYQLSFNKRKKLTRKSSTIAPVLFLILPPGLAKAGHF